MKLSAEFKDGKSKLVMTPEDEWEQKLFKMVGGSSPPHH